MKNKYKSFEEYKEKIARFKGTNNNGDTWEKVKSGKEYQAISKISH